MSDLPRRPRVRRRPTTATSAGIAMDPDATSLHAAVDAPADAGGRGRSGRAGGRPSARTARPPTCRTRCSARRAATTSRPARCRAPIAPPSATASPSAPRPASAPPSSAAARTPRPRSPGGWPRCGSTPTGTPPRRATTPLPSPGLPARRTAAAARVLVGRASRSRNIHPDVDCSSDTGVSRRHAQLTTDGTALVGRGPRSSNGTYVADTVGALPKTPVPAGQKQEIPATGGCTSVRGPGSRSGGRCRRGRLKGGRGRGLGSRRREIPKVSRNLSGESDIPAIRPASRRSGPDFPMRTGTSSGIHAPGGARKPRYLGNSRPGVRQRTHPATPPTRPPAPHPRPRGDG